LRRGEVRERGRDGEDKRFCDEKGGSNVLSITTWKKIIIPNIIAGGKGEERPVGMEKEKGRRGEGARVAK